MQDKILETVGGLTDIAARLEKQMLPIIPYLTQLQNDAENANPEMMDMYNKEMEKIKEGREELERVKDKIRNFKA